MAEGKKKKITIEELDCIVVQFCIPHKFRLKDSSGDGHPGKPYDIVLNDTVARVELKTIHDYRYQKAGGMQLSSPLGKAEDRHGIFSFTKVYVSFDDTTFKHKLPDPDFLLGPNNLEILIRLSVAYLNKFITEYRHISRDHWVRQITKREIFSYYAFLATKDKRTEWVFSGIELEEPANKVDLRSLISDEEDLKLRGSIQCEEPFFRSELFLDALEYRRTGKHNMAILLSVTRFENFVYSELTQVLSKRKLDRIKKKETCGCMEGISQVCTRGFKEVFDFDFEATEEWRNIRDKAIRIRNKIVHGEQLAEVTKDACKEALDAVAIAETYIHNNLFRNLEGYVYPKVRS